MGVWRRSKGWKYGYTGKDWDMETKRIGVYGGYPKGELIGRDKKGLGIWRQKRIGDGEETQRMEI